MSTVGREIAKNLIKGEGYYNGDTDNGDPRAVKIVRYENAWGGESYGVIWEGDDLDQYRPTEFVRNPVTVWSL